MKKVTEKLPNGNTIEYKIVNDTAYHAETSWQIVAILEIARKNSIRLKICFGDTETGKDWQESFHTTGYIGRSTGTIKIPLLVHNSRSLGGPPLLDHCIVKIQESKGGKVLYQHPHYHITE